MSQWANQNVATLKVKSANDATKTFTFLGVNANNSAGSPEDVLAATNRLLAVINQAAVKQGMKKAVTLEVTE